MLLHNPFLCRAFPDRYKIRILIQIFAKPPKPNKKNNHGNDAKFNFPRVGFTVQWARSKPARTNTPAGISTIFRKKPADSACNNQKGQHLGLENKFDAIRAENQPQKKSAQPITAIRNSILHTKQKRSDGNSPIRPPFFVPSKIFTKF